MNIVEIGSRGMDCIVLAQDRDEFTAFVKAVMNFRVFIRSCITGGPSSSAWLHGVSLVT
jgi:hypothetical protein